MPTAAQAYAALSTILSVGVAGVDPVTYTAIAKISNFDGPKMAADTVETTTYGSSGFKEYQGTLVSGTADIELVWTSETTQELLLTDFLTPGGAPKPFEVSYPTAMTSKKFTGSGVVNKLELKNPIGGVYSASVSIQFSGVLGYA